MPKKHVLFLVPDGVGIKNFLYSKCIDHLKLESKLTIWSPLPIEAFSDVKKNHDIDFEYKNISLVAENSITRLYREATTYARLIRNSKQQKNPTILTNWRRPNYSFKVKLLYKCAEILGAFLSKKYSRILRYEKKSSANISKNIINKYVKNLEAIQPSSILITHQRVPGLMPICIAAKQLGIKTMTAIFSWDNLPKARLSVKTDYYLVWSQWMKDEMKAYYPEISEAKVKLVGTPQFEFYLDKSRISQREDFALKYGLDAKKQWICFSGDDITTSPYDHLFLKDVVKALVAKKEEIQIIFRRCPVDFSDRYNETLENYKGFVFSIDPIWNIESETNWTGYFPKYRDINMQVDLANHCSLILNLGSTMALDFATCNKPCLYLNYNPSKDHLWSTEVVYNYQHFRSMKNLNAVGWITKKEEILKAVINALNAPNTIATDRKKWLETIVLHPLDGNSINISKALL